MIEVAVRPKDHSQGDEPRKLLIRGVNWLGDAVMGLPAMQRLREKFPQARITLLTHAKLEELWRGHSAIDAVLTFRPNDTLWSLARQLRLSQFDTALILPNSPRSALESWLAGIPRRVGYGASWRALFLTDAVRPPEIKMHKRSAREVKELISRNHPTRPAELTPHDHQVHNYLRLTAALGCSDSVCPPSLEMSREETQEIMHAFEGMLPVKGKDSAVRLGLNISAAYGSAKRWPLERFAAVIRDLHHRLPNSIWLAFGAPEDRELNEELVKRAEGSIINLAGRTSLRQLMALLKNCRVLLTNDSGPMHLAAALDTPVVVPFGSTSPELTGPAIPGTARHQILKTNVPCSPCFRRECPIDLRCMTSITVEQAVNAVLRSIAIT